MGRDAAVRSTVKTVHRRLFLAKAAKQLCCEPGVATSVSEAIRVAVGLLKRNYYPYSFVTIPHPPAVGAPFRTMWALICPLTRFFSGQVPLRLVGGGTRASRPTETENDIPNEYLPAAARRRADEERPYLSSQSLILPLLKCHFDRSVSEVEKSPAVVTR